MLCLVMVMIKYGNWEKWEEIRKSCQRLFMVLGCGRIIKKDITVPYYEIEYEYDTVRYGRLSHFIAYIPIHATVLLHSEKEDLRNSSSYTVYDCRNGYYAEFYKGNAENPYEFAVYIKSQ